MITIIFFFLAMKLCEDIFWYYFERTSDIYHCKDSGEQKQ